MGLRRKGLGAWSLVLIGKVPGTQTPGYEGEEDRVATAVFLIGEILEDYILATQEKKFGWGWEQGEEVGVVFHADNSWKRRKLICECLSPKKDTKSITQSP